MQTFSRGSGFVRHKIEVGCTKAVKIGNESAGQRGRDVQTETARRSVDAGQLGVRYWAWLTDGRPRLEEGGLVCRRRHLAGQTKK